MKINLIFVDNGVGLTRDADILTDVIHKFKPDAEVNRIDIYKQVNLKKADINIFLEVIDHNGQFFQLAKVNYYMPNPEWYAFAWDKYLSQFDAILCKTHDTERIFKAKGLKTVYTSFSSVDRMLTVINNKYRAFLHTAGQSETKGSDKVVKAYDNIRDEALGLIFTRSKGKPNYWINNNAQGVFDRIPDAELRTLQNACIFHLCPSMYEGFGHYIDEARSCGGIIITTGAWPMAELVPEEIGIHVPVESTSAMSLATLQHVSVDGLAEAMMKATNMNHKQIGIKSLAARAFYLKNKSIFEGNIKNVLGL